jgi:hypothetical protein
MADSGLDLLQAVEDLRKGLLFSKSSQKEKPNKFLMKDAVDWLITEGKMTEDASLRHLQSLLQQNYICPVRSTLEKQVFVMEKYYFQSIGEGKSFIDLNSINWEQLSLQFFASKSGIKIKHRWKNLKRYNDCFLGNISKFMRFIRMENEFWRW